jgi:hypothetical protein
VQLGKLGHTLEVRGMEFEGFLSRVKSSEGKLNSGDFAVNKLQDLALVFPTDKSHAE